jgi:hypothetical protein
MVLPAALLLAACSEQSLRYAILGQNPGGSLTVESLPSGARLFVDGADSGKTTPISIVNLESEIVHTLRLELPGEAPQTSTVSLAAAERKRTLILIESAMVQLSVKSDPEKAELSLDGRTIAFTPSRSPVRVGKELRLRVAKVGYRTYEQTVIPARGRPIELSIALEKNEELFAEETPQPAKKTKKKKKLSSRRRAAMARRL